MVATIEEATAIARDTLKLAERTADQAMAKGGDLPGISAMFLARAYQAFDSCMLLASRGSVADAMSVGRTVVELDIDYAYIVKDVATRLPLFVEYERIANHKIAVGR